MDTFAKHTDDDLDLDALMVRVREAATATDASAATAPLPAGDASGPESDLIRIIDAQGQWNEQTRKALTELVEGLRLLHDDWADAQTNLRREIGRLSALVDERRTTPDTTAARRQPSTAATRGRRVIRSPRTGTVKTTKGGKPQS